MNYFLRLTVGYRSRTSSVRPELPPMTWTAPCGRWRGADLSPDGAALGRGSAHHGASAGRLAVLAAPAAVGAADLRRGGPADELLSAGPGRLTHDMPAAESRW